MTNQTPLAVAPRTITGKRVYQLRKQNLVPGHVFGGGTESILIQVDALTISKLYEEVGETGLITLTVEGDKASHPVLIDEVQLDPVTDSIITVSFKEVNLKEKIKADIPVEVVGEVDVKDATVNLVVETIEVEALPADLPDHFEIDVSGFTEIGQTVTYAQLDYDKSKVKLMIDDEEMDEPVVILQKEEEMAEPEEPAEVVEGEEGEAPAGEEGQPETGEKPAGESEKSEE